MLGIESGGQQKRTQNMSESVFSYMSINLRELATGHWPLYFLPFPYSTKGATMPLMMPIAATAQ